MISLRNVFVIAHTALLLSASAVYIASHGGVGGDYEYIPGNDVVTSPADVGQVLFNRWHVTSEESWPVKAFLYLNLPSFICARLMFSSAAFVVEELKRTFPFGLSFLSYIALVGLPLTFIQWYWVGRLAERLRGKESGGNRGQEVVNLLPNRSNRTT